MEPNPSSLGEKIARLHGAVQAQEKRVWMPNAVHALIMACLTRIFARLEHVIQLWQAGLLPSLPIPATTHSNAVRAPHPPIPRPIRQRSKSRARTAIAPARRSAETQNPPIDVISGDAAPDRALIPPAHPCPRPARAPPAVRSRVNRPCAATPNNALIVTIMNCSAINRPALA